MFAKMKLSPCLIVLAVCIVVGLGGAVTNRAYGQQSVSPGLIPNSGFENGQVGWSFSGANVVLTDGVARTGGTSLRMTNDNRANTPWAAHKMNARPGRVCSVTGWIKTDGLEGVGAFLKISWSDQNDVGLAYGESRPVTVAADWTRIDFSVRIPRNASYMKLTVFLKDCTGTAWFDDLQVVPDDSTMLRGLIRYPGYRQTIFPGQDKRIAAGYEVKGSSTHPLEQLEVDLKLQDAENKQLAHITSQGPLDKSWSNFGFNLGNYSPGRYRISAELVDKGTREILNRDSMDFAIAGDSEIRPRIYVDDQNRCVVDGKPFFPVGLYVSKGTEDDLNRISEARFNCVVDYAALARPLDSMSSYLDLFTAKGLKLLFSLKDCYDPLDGSMSVTQYGPWKGSFEVVKGLVGTFKSHPAILAWYLNEEKAGPHLPQIVERYKWIRENDRDHPVWQTIWGAQDMWAHIGSSDIVSMDVYPVWQMYKDKSTNPHLEIFGSETGRVWDDIMGSRCITMVPECSSFRKLTPDSRPPTYEDMLCLAYQALIGGARGLIFFSYDWLKTSDGDSQWAEVRRLGHTLDWLRPIALGTDVPPVDRVQPSDSRIAALTRIADGQIYVLAVNPYNEGITARFSLGHTAGVQQVEVILPSGVSSVLSVSENAFTDTIGPRGTRAYRLRL